MAVCNMLLVTVALFGRSQLYIIESLSVVLHVKFNARPSIIVLLAGVRVITAVPRSKGQFRGILISLQVYLFRCRHQYYMTPWKLFFSLAFGSCSKYRPLSVRCVAKIPGNLAIKRNSFLRFAKQLLYFLEADESYQ